VKKSGVKFNFSSNLKSTFDPEDVEKMTISKFLAFAQKISEETNMMDVKDIPVTKVVLTPAPKIYKYLKEDPLKSMVRRIFRKLKVSALMDLKKLMAEIVDVKKTLESFIV